ncbi:MAG: glycosyltransferase family 2 protein [Alphaproteobacteria bacterium]|nr:glycosyltransferase family 2 protein [Alphaproteobacteria bacterium]
MLSVVIPVFNEEGSIKTLIKNINTNIQKIKTSELIDDYEIIFVDDGSGDSSQNIIKEAIDTDVHIKLITFRTNFGKSKALEAGFRYAKGDIVITMDADLQDDPKEIRRFIEKIDEGYDLVSGWKENRLDPLEKRLPSKLFNWVTSKLSGIKIHDFNCGYKAYKKEVVKSIAVYGEFHRYIPVLAKRNGFRVTEISVTHHKRQHGASKFGCERYLRGLYDAISSWFLLKYYEKPMYFFGKIGLILLSVGGLVCSYLTCLWFLGYPIGTRPLLTLGVMLILIGAQFISMGLIANILVDQDKRRANDTLYIKEIYERK